MKVRPQELARHLAKLDPAIAAALIFGPDQGLVAERAARIAEQIAPGPSDSMQRIEIKSETLEKHPSAAYDAVAEANLFGGRRLVWIDGAGDAVAASLADVLDHDLPGFLLVTAGDLKAKSNLRKRFEGAKTALAIACYADDAQTRRQLVQDSLAEDGLRATNEALDYLVANLGADRRLSRAELEKLKVYMASAASPTVGLDDARSCVADTAGMALEDIAAAALDGDGAEVDRLYHRALGQGDSPVAIVRVLLKRIDRLAQIHILRQQGANASEAVERLRPPVFWRDKARLQAQSERWGPKLLSRALALAVDAEIEAKSTGVPAEAAVGRLLLRLAQAGARPAAR